MPIEEIDMVVALCAVSSQSNQSFELMKDTVKSIVDKYGTSKIHYSVVIYGQSAFPTAALSRTSFTKKDVKEYIDSIPKPRGNYNTIGSSIYHLTLIIIIPPIDILIVAVCRKFVT